MSFTDVAKSEQLAARIVALKSERLPLVKRLKASTESGTPISELPATDKSRLITLQTEIEQAEGQLKALSTDYADRILSDFKSGRITGAESCFGDHPGSGGGGNGFAGVKDGLGSTMVGAGFDLATRPKVKVKSWAALKASTYPSVTDWSRREPVIVPQGLDMRFLWPFLPREDKGTELTVQDFTQTDRTLTGTVKRAPDATSTKAKVTTATTLVAEVIPQHAVTIDDIPNALFESIPTMAAFLQSQGEFEVMKSIDNHIYAQIVAAAPPFGNTGTPNLIDEVRYGIKEMRAFGANPTLLVLNPTDAAALDLYTSDDGTYFFLGSDGANGMWKLRIVERAGAGTEPPYLIDPALLGVLYLGAMDIAADPFTGFKENLTTLRVETSALFHVRNAKGARRIAAS